MPAPRPPWRLPGLVALLVPLLAGAGPAAFPGLRESHDDALQAALDEALYAKPAFRTRIETRKAGLVVADVSDLAHPRVASYNPDLMLYAASLPKIAIALGAFVEIDAGHLQLDAELHRELVRMVKVSSNRDASAVLRKVGVERLAEILQDPRYGRLYDPTYGGGLWVGKAYDKSPVWKRDPIHGISQGASAMAAARFYYGALTGELIDAKYLPVLQEMFGKPALQHKFVKGLKGRDVRIFRKSGTWRDYHADSGVIVQPGGATYIIAAIGRDSQGGKRLAELIRTVDDLMRQQAASSAAP